MSDPHHRFQALCHEAVLACGADLEAIRRYIDARIAAMDAVDRDRIEKDIELVLAFKPSDRPSWDQ